MLKNGFKHLVEDSGIPFVVMGKREQKQKQYIHKV